MYKHQIHKGFTYLIFIFANLSILSIMVPVLFKNIGDYTFLFCFLFSSAGAFIFSELYFSINEVIEHKGILMTIYRNFFIYLGYIMSIALVLAFNWMLISMGYFNELSYTLFSLLGGLIWLISLKIAIVFPNIRVQKEQ